ncbi:MAG: sugar phosphate isomerase/epimerase family protein [Anaerolineae bacterium]
MYMSISTGGLFPLSLDAMFRHCARAGFDGVELVVNGSNLIQMAEETNRLSALHHLPVYSVHQRLLLKHASGVWYDWMLEAADLALRTRARYVILHNPNAARWESGIAQRWLRTLDMAQRRLQGSGIRIALENNNPHAPEDNGKLLARLTDLSAFARQHDTDLTYDTCHAAAAGIDVLAGWNLIGRQVVNIHLSDRIPRPIPGNSSLIRSLISDHQLPGKGVLPLDALRQQLVKDNYAGAITLEVSPLALPTLCIPRLQPALTSLVQFGKS